MLRRALTAAAGLLVGFHAWLFVGQVWDGRAFEPATAARWLLAGCLVLALAALRRTGQPLVFSRRAAAVWLLAALLHAPRAIDGVQALPPDIWTEVATVAGGLSAAAAGLAFALSAVLAALLARRRPSRPGLAVCTQPAAADGAFGFALTLAARPPPG
jgi:hypothetical protein